MKKITPLHITLVILGLIALALLNTMLHADDAPQEPTKPKTAYVDIEEADTPPDVDEYKAAQVAHSEKLGKVLGDMATMNQRLSSNPNLIQDPNFLAEVQAVADRMDQLESEIATLPKPPIEFEVSDGLYRQSFAAFSEGIDYYVRGVNENDLDMMAISIDRIDTGNELMGQAIQEINGGN